MFISSGVARLTILTEVLLGSSQYLCLYVQKNSKNRGPYSVPTGESKLLGKAAGQPGEAVDQAPPGQVGQPVKLWAQH